MNANKQIIRDYSIQMTDSLTISGLALKLFLSNFYKSEPTNIPHINKSSMYNDINRGYYGGIV